MTDVNSTTTTSAEEQVLETAAIAAFLDDRYPVAGVRPGRIRLATPAATLNAADWLERHGIPAIARSTGGWELQLP